MMKNKKGISPIIATILLILIAIFAAMLISSVVIPLVKESIGEGGECFKTIDQLKIDTQSGYTCYSGSTPKIVNITVQRGPKKAEIIRFVISVHGEGANQLFEIQEGKVTNVTMLNGNKQLELPRLGEERTYSLTTSFSEISYVTISPVVKGGKRCDPVDEAYIEQC